MKKKTKLLFLSTSLLMSCASKNVPDDIVNYLNNCSIYKAFEKTKTVDYTFTSSLYDGDEKLGETDLFIYWDNRNADRFYEHQVEKYQGNKIVYDDENKIYVTSKEINSYFDTDEEIYHKVTTLKGYINQNKQDEIKEIRYSDVKYQKKQFDSEKEILFRSQETSGISKGGIYYADFFKNLLSYYPYMSIENDKLIYKLENYPYKNDDEEGLINEEIKMNSLGLLTYLEQVAKNTKTNKKSLLNVSVSYDTKTE